jgi:hypothetical protein
LAQQTTKVNNPDEALQNNGLFELPFLTNAPKNKKGKTHKRPQYADFNFMKLRIQNNQGSIAGGKLL